MMSGILRGLLTALCVSFLLLPAAAQETPAQEAPAPPDPAAWKPDLTAKLAGSQASFQNWAEGGVSTLAFSSGLDGHWERTTRGWSQRYETRFTFGMVKQDTLDFRKAEDIIRLTATYRYTGHGTLDTFSPTVAFRARSQFAPGYNFDKNQFKKKRPLPQKVSDLMSPGVFTQALGLTYAYRPWMTQRIGIGGKQTVVLIDRLRELYNLDIDETVRVEVGLEAYTDFDKELFTNVHLKSTLGLFAAFNKPEKPDLIWENALAMKVNSWLQFNVEWAVMRDDDVSRRFQFKEVFSVGIVYHILEV